MSEMMRGWTSEVERSFKEILFRFLEEVHCTKAALYLLAEDGSYALMAQYGFGRKDLLAAEHRAQDPLVLKARELRVKPLAVNHPKEFPEIANYMRDAGTHRMMLLPLYGASRVLGFVDARDKGGKRPFEASDLRQASVIASAFLRLLQRQGLYPDLDVAEPPVPAEPLLRPSTGLLPDLSGAFLDDPALRDLNDVVVETVAQAEVFAVAVTVSTADSAATVAYSGNHDEGVEFDAITRHQAEALVQVGVSAPHHSSWRTELRRLPAATDNLRPSLIASAVPLHSRDCSLCLSVIGAEGSALPTIVLDRLRRSAETCREMTELRFARRGLARRLLQPGERKYPDLLAHCLAVSRLCWLMAQVLEFDDRDSEEAALAGLLHDVGMRELDYERLYRHPAPGSEERRVYQGHVVVGERILQGTGLDSIGRAIRHHHERWDGRGYPDRIGGERIPLLSRLVHVAEVFDVLTSSSSYRPTVPVEQALATIRAAAGQQFDTGLVQVLTRVVS